MPKKFLLISIIIVLILIGISFNFGYQVGVRKEVEVKEEPLRIWGLEASTVITRQNANAVGEVIEILNQTLTLLANGDALTVQIAGDAIIERAWAIGDDLDIPPPKVVEFQDIKKGNRVGIYIELLPDGNFIGRHIMIFH